jgi:hypothetical protein
MTDHRRSAGAPRRPAAPRKPWVPPAVTVITAGAAEFGGSGSDDSADLS